MLYFAEKNLKKLLTKRRKCDILTVYDNISAVMKTVSQEHLLTESRRRWEDGSRSCVKNTSELAEENRLALGIR